MVISQAGNEKYSPHGRDLVWPYRFQPVSSELILFVIEPATKINKNQATRI